MGDDDLRVLLIEDVESDVILFTLAIKQSGLNIHLSTVEDARAGMDYISGKGVYGDRQKYPFPDLIVSGLLLRIVSGVIFLKWCRATELCRHLPLVVLTGALETEKAIQDEALQSGANRLYFKPGNLDDLTNIVREIYHLGKEYRTRNHPKP